MKNAPLTVVMFVYNDEKWLHQTIDSLLNQTFPDFKIILSDDCSTDNSKDICEEYAKKDKRITYIRQPKNLGSFLHAKLWFGKINTPFFLPCAGHDVYHPQFIEKLLPLLQKNEEIVIAYPKSQVIKYSGDLGEINTKDDYTTDTIDNPAKRYIYTSNKLRSVTIIQGIWRSAILKKIYLKPTISNDVTMILHASLYGKFQQYPEILFFMRQNRPTSATESMNDMFYRQIKMITGKKSKEILFLRKMQFMYENIVMICKQKNLSFTQKIYLSLYSIFLNIKKLYIAPPYFVIKNLLSK